VLKVVDLSAGILQQTRQALFVEESPLK